MPTRNKLDAIAGTLFLVFSLLITSIILPDFGMNVFSFVTNQFAIAVGIVLMAFIVAFLQRKAFR